MSGLTKRIKLWPVTDASGVVPFLWQDAGSRERTYMACAHGTEVVFAHESGYGFLRREDVCLMPAIYSNPEEGHP